MEQHWHKLLQLQKTNKSEKQIQSIYTLEHL